MMGPFPTPHPSSFLLLTGATGFIGFEILQQALQAGYNVRCAVRTEAKADSLRSNTSIQKLNPGPRLSFIIVPDILIPGCYNTAMKNVTHAIHASSPVPSPGTDPSALVSATELGITNILSAAQKTGNKLRHLVITSSLVANLALPSNPSATLTTVHTRIPLLPDGPYDNTFTAYRAAKIRTLAATDAFRQEIVSCSFGVSNIFPGFVYGRNRQAKTWAESLNCSNRALIQMLQGQTVEPPRLASAAHINDVAKVHLLAVARGEEEEGDWAVCLPVKHGDAVGFVEGMWPGELGEGGLFGRGKMEGVEIEYEAGETRRVFRVVFKGFEEVVGEVAR